jgi:hypothetical protein
MNYKLQCFFGICASIIGLLVCVIFITPITILFGGFFFFAGLITIIMTIPKEEKITKYYRGN